MKDYSFIAKLRLHLLYSCKIIRDKGYEIYSVKEDFSLGSLKTGNKVQPHDKIIKLCCFLQAQFLFLYQRLLLFSLTLVIPIEL